MTVQVQLVHAINVNTVVIKSMNVEIFGILTGQVLRYFLLDKFQHKLIIFSAIYISPCKLNVVNYLIQ